MSTKTDEKSMYDGIQDAVRSALIDIKNDIEHDAHMENRAALLRKKSAFRADALTLDWSDDKMVRLGGAGSYPYLSADKVKRNFAPLLSKHGLDMDLHFTSLTKWDGPDDNKYHWTLVLQSTIYDVDTGASMSSETYGEGADTGESGIKKAQACALKQWLTSEFLIADGIDPDAVQNVSVSGGFHKKTEEEQGEIISKVKSHGVTAEPEKKEEPQPEPVAELSKKETPKKVAPKNDAPKKEELKAKEVVANAPAAPVDEKKPEKAEEHRECDNQPGSPMPKPGVKLSKPHLNAIEHITTEWEARAKSGTVSVEEYNQMSMDCASISSPAEAVAFVKKYRVG